MAQFRIHRLKPAQREQFRWAPHTSGTSTVRPKDYTDAGTIEASSPYGAWAALRNSDQPLEVGDVLETADGTLLLCKYVGFEQARWFVPETAAAAAAPSEAAAVPAPSPQS